MKSILSDLDQPILFQSTAMQIIFYSKEMGFALKYKMPSGNSSKLTSVIEYKM